MGSGHTSQCLPSYISSIHIPSWKDPWKDPCKLRNLRNWAKWYAKTATHSTLCYWHCWYTVVCSCSLNVPFKSCRFDLKPLCQTSAASKLVTAREGSIEKIFSVRLPTVKWRIIIAYMMLTLTTQTCYMDQVDNFLQVASITGWIISFLHFCSTHKFSGSACTNRLSSYH